MTARWFLGDSGPGEPAKNMALDDALLRSARELAVPVLRFYGWARPAATFGYFQRIVEVESSTALRPLIRRPTGGGLVPHAGDWTYSLTVPPGHAWYRLRAGESYQAMHRWLQAAFAGVGLPTELAGCCRKEMAGQCFKGYERHDLLSLGRKLAGAAQRRNKLGLLLQGSIQPPPPGVGREEFLRSMMSVGARVFEGNAEEFKPSGQLVGLAERLAVGCYEREDYNRRR